MAKRRKNRKDRDRHRFYLLPGMGKGNRRKHHLFVRWSIVIGLIVSAVMAVVLYYVNR